MPKFSIGILGLCCLIFLSKSRLIAGLFLPKIAQPLPCANFLLKKGYAAHFWFIDATVLKVHIVVIVQCKVGEAPLPLDFCLVVVEIIVKLHSTHRFMMIKYWLSVKLSRCQELQELPEGPLDTSGSTSEGTSGVLECWSACRKEQSQLSSSIVVDPFQLPAKGTATNNFAKSRTAGQKDSRTAGQQ